MEFDRDVVAAKLRRWEKYLYNYRLPAWNEIPDIGLYMDQLIMLTKDYLDYMPPEIKAEKTITAAAVNNYVRMKVMPEPVKKRYYRRHIVYLIIICTLKQSLSIARIGDLVPCSLSEEELEDFYGAYADLHRSAAQYFIAEVRQHAGPILDRSDDAPRCANELVLRAAIAGGLATLFSEKLSLLSGLTPDSPGIDLTIPNRRT